MFLENVDNATLRIDCANHLLTVMHIQLSSEECDQPTNSVLAGALYGIHMLVSDAYELLAK